MWGRGVVDLISFETVPELLEVGITPLMLVALSRKSQARPATEKSWSPALCPHMGTRSLVESRECSLCVMFFT